MADLLAESERQRKQMDEERQKMLADISHDLKTPITVISGYTKALKDGKIPPEKAAGYLELIDSKAEELTGLVNSFHQFSVTSHPAFMLQTETCDLCEFMRSYLADRYDEIDLAGFCIHVMIPETKLVCNLDRPQMRRALDNIVYNALKYNRLGTELTFAVFPVEKVIGGEKSARIVIADNGIGIPPSKRESIFEPFVQGDESRGSGGSGLGLSITKRIVQAHCGSICCCMPSEIREAELTFSAGSGGTAFEILLPLTTCAEEL
jgi:signal transduction histidine kinase